MCRLSFMGGRCFLGKNTVCYEGDMPSETETKVLYSVACYILGPNQSGFRLATLASVEAVRRFVDRTMGIVLTDEESGLVFESCRDWLGESWEMDEDTGESKEECEARWFAKVEGPLKKHR